MVLVQRLEFDLVLAEEMLVLSQTQQQLPLREATPTRPE
jgi:hypothetical protein